MKASRYFDDADFADSIKRAFLHSSLDFLDAIKKGNNIADSPRVNESDVLRISAQELATAHWS